VCLVFIAENQKPNSPKEKLSLSLFIRPAGKKKKVSLSSSLKSYVFSLCGSANKEQNKRTCRRNKKRNKKNKKEKTKERTMCDRLKESLERTKTKYKDK
jgi:hypothetical protein